MRNCVLSVTEREYAEILQLNHGALMWSNRDRELLDRLETLLGKSVADQVRRYDVCRMEKGEASDGPRVREDREEVGSPPLAHPMPIDLSGENFRGEVPGCPTGLSGMGQSPPKEAEKRPPKTSESRGREE